MVKRRDRELMSLVDNVVAGELDRRDFVRRMSALGAGAIFGGPLAAAIAARGASAAPSGTGRPAAVRFQDPPPVRGGTIVAATIDKPVNMDPAFAQLYSSMQVYQNVFNKLVYVDADFNFIPGLAKSWTQVDPVTWDFELYENVFFHNDEPFTARDVAFSLERVLDPALAAPNAIFLQAVDRVETTGDYKARIVLKQPSGSFLTDLCSVLEIVNETAITTKDPRLEPVGTGPFKFTEWVQDDHITLERWEKYHVPDRPYLDKVIFKAIADDTVRLTGLQTNEMQWVMQVPLQKVDELKNEEDIKVTVGKPFLPDHLFLNCTRPPFNDVRVRQALAWCIDRQQIVNVAFFGQADVATEPIYSGNPYFSGINIWEGGPDYDKAKALLEEAGVPGLKFVLDGQPQVPTQVKTAQVLQQQFAKAGMEMDIQNVDSATWFDRFATKTYDATISYWSVTIDPAQFAFPLLLSTSPWAFTGYGSPEMDAVLNTFAQETDVEKRKEAYKALIQKYQEEAPLIPLDNQLQQYWVRANVYGMTPLPSMEIRMEPVYIAE
ncbi:MAG: peptide/nickel transport system substrate-binding protein [Thermomicrobiales bacterium]|nr:peptide/nickel transport system substrate-binding protein [Thermomicrobiales bacterium]MEA2527039.1 peptide/nickel transport system substrate-binding protein [Thermomicrobiales bacterium]MEA2585158.1 peptide/nickel transport system substrate-binding protein [Thermomicrobiales bacterium]